MSTFTDKIINIEKKLRVSLPLDYVSFMRELEVLEGKGGFWYSIEDLHNCNDLNITDYYIFKELEGTIFTEEDFKYLIPIFNIENESGYVVIDTRENSFGTFLIFYNEDEIKKQYINFTEFLKDKDNYNELF